ncbi:TetR/AcrR family transcriptional regulator [Pseudoalteromonas sp. Of7M-16]|uniref:TetR/AcrR family transcriptional regulator n=1 Tax=Pseudoalteromonas sp. Of7M-16 TaxID=2917756 RepID=UPI001EF6B361|nr:TetR/AcrR family transcriptional regulator [Pseudoalteromonas sp. Of7M-16]MCG7550095.1 TetR/AcrR family transcriptional regulator [Pseudoalteromonas sp. Of7M-16]
MKKREITAQKILDVSWQLFQKHGYAETTTRQIAAEASVATGTVFSHFPNKIDILKLAMHQRIDEVLRLAHQENEQTSPRLRLRHYAKFLYRFYCENRPFSKALLQDLMWHSAFFEDQLNDFKHMLFEGHKYDEIKATAMMDCYFMTLIYGLNNEQLSPVDLVSLLTAKLQMIHT